MQLRITAGPDAGKTIEPAGERFTIGREDVDFLLADDEVSRQHFEIRNLPDGRVEVADLGSRNGTRVNGERIAEPRTLVGGEEISVGTTTIVVEGPPPVAETVVGGEIPTGEETVVAGEQPGEPDPDATAVGAPPPPAPPPDEPTVAPPPADEPTAVPPPAEEPTAPLPPPGGEPTAPQPLGGPPTPPPPAAGPPAPSPPPTPSPPPARPPAAPHQAPPAFTQRPAAASTAGGEAALWKRVTALVLAILLALATIIFAIVAIDLSGTPTCGEVGFLEDCYLGSEGERNLGVALLGLGVVSAIAFLVFSILYFAKSRFGWLALGTGIASALLYTLGLVLG